MRVMCFALAGLLVSACGTKGPLVLPPAPIQTPPAAAPPADAATTKAHANKPDSGATTPEMNQ